MKTKKLRKKRVHEIILLYTGKSNDPFQQFMRNISEHRLKRLYDKLSTGMPMSLACKELGLAKKYVQKMMDENPSIREFLEDAESDPKDRVKYQVYKQAMEGHFPSQAFILERTTDEYAPPVIKQELKATHNVKEERGMIIVLANTSKKKRKKLLHKPIIDVEATVRAGNAKKDEEVT